IQAGSVAEAARADDGAYDLIARSAGVERSAGRVALALRGLGAAPVGQAARAHKRARRGGAAGAIALVHAAGRVAVRLGQILARAVAEAAGPSRDAIVLQL